MARIAIQSDLSKNTVAQLSYDFETLTKTSAALIIVVTTSKKSTNLIALNLTICLITYIPFPIY